MTHKFMLMLMWIKVNDESFHQMAKKHTHNKKIETDTKYWRNCNSDFATKKQKRSTRIHIEQWTSWIKTYISIVREPTSWIKNASLNNIFMFRVEKAEKNVQLFVNVCKFNGILDATTTYAIAAAPKQWKQKASVCKKMYSKQKKKTWKQFSPVCII